MSMVNNTKRSSMQKKSNTFQTYREEEKKLKEK